MLRRCLRREGALGIEFNYMANDHINDACIRTPQCLCIIRCILAPKSLHTKLNGTFWVVDIVMCQEGDDAAQVHRERMQNLPIGDLPGHYPIWFVRGLLLI